MRADRFGDFMKRLRFLIINEYKNFGGTENSVWKIRQILTSHGHEVFLIYMHVGQDEVLGEKEYVLNPRFGIFDKLFYNPLLAHKLKQILCTISPDVIILNNVFFALITVLSTLKDYKVLHMVRDYAAVCPKSTCITDSGEVCSGFELKKCLYECKYHNSKIKLFIKLLLTKRIDGLRMRYVHKSLPPSRALSEYLIQYGHRSSPLNDPSEYGECPEKCMSDDYHKYIYLGVVNDNKGVYDLVQAFKLASFSRKCELHIYGHPATNYDYMKITSLIKSCDRIFYHGSIPHEEVQSVLKDAYALIVPSKWLENYPGTCLEGMANKLLVIASDRGGMKEQLADGRGIIFRFGVDELVDALYKAEALPASDYRKITERAYKYVLQNNSYLRYYQRLMSEINQVISTVHI